MLKLYAVTVWHTSEPRHFETIEVRTYSANRAEHLATESYPGCKAHTSDVLVKGAWHDTTHIDSSKEQRG
jgi:hypothetical protein